MGIDRIHDFGAQFGLGQKTGIDLPNERRGLWPSREWKVQTQRLPWFPGDSLNVGIGQGFALATPLQMATMVATIANRGKHMQPQVVKSINGEILPPKVINQVEVADRYWDHIFKAMKDVMHASNGTARRAGSKSSYLMAGKTGTAQVVGIKQGEEYDSEALKERNRDHALFVGFAPFDNPKIAVAVIVENGESGSGTAAPIARKMFDAHLLNSKGAKQKLATKLVSKPTVRAVPVASSRAMSSPKLAQRGAQ
jgi:penicillin-binding protein 2